jgi:hypothetical protein
MPDTTEDNPVLTTSVPTFYLVRDITSTLSANLISNERHTLPDTLIKVIAPDFGGFYVNSLVVNTVNTTTNNLTPLIAGVDYKCMEVDAPDTSESGKEVAHVILITKTTIDLTFDITYQAVGGSNSPSVPLLVQAFDTLNVNHKVRNWNDVAHKPDAYPPNPHLHDSKDMYGLEYIVRALDNLKSIIGHSAYDTVHEYLIKKIKAKLSSITPTISSVINNQLDTLSILTDRAEKTLIYTYAQYLFTTKRLEEIKFTVNKLASVSQEYMNNNYDGVYANLLTELAKKQSRTDLMILDTPNRIEDLELWLDADDLTTIQTIENQMIWIDKSLNQRHYISVLTAIPNIISSGGIRGNCFELITGKYFNKFSGRDLNFCLNMTIICITNALQPSDINNSILLSDGNDSYSIHGNVSASQSFKVTGNNLEVSLEANANNFPRISVLALSKDVENSYSTSVNLLTKQTISATINPTLDLSTINATLNIIGSTTAVQSSAINQLLVYNRRLAKCEIDCIVEYFYQRNKS